MTKVLFPRKDRSHSIAVAEVSLLPRIRPSFASPYDFRNIVPSVRGPLAGTMEAANSSAFSSRSGGRCRTARPLRDGSDPPREPPVEPSHRASRRTSPARRCNRQRAIGGAFLRRRDGTARPLSVVNYSAAVNRLRDPRKKRASTARLLRSPGGMAARSSSLALSCIHAPTRWQAIVGDLPRGPLMGAKPMSPHDRLIPAKPE